MKRDQSTIFHADNAAADADTQLRRRLQREADAEERAERVEQANKAELKRLTAHLTNWTMQNISIATDYSVAEPVPIPNGAFKFPLN